MTNFILGLTNQKYAKLLPDRYVIYSLLKLKQLYRSSPRFKVLNTKTSDLYSRIPKIKSKANKPIYYNSLYLLCSDVKKDLSM